MKSQTGRPAPLRRQHDRAFKLELVRQTMSPGASVSAVALRGDVNANLLFRWRRELQSLVGVRSEVALVPVQVIAQRQPADGFDAAGPVASKQPRKPPSPPSPPAGMIELDIDGILVRLHGGVDEANLCSVLRALRRSA